MTLTRAMKGSALLKKILPDRVVLSVQKRRYARSLSALRVGDCTDFRAMKNLVGAGDTVVDVGANMGEYTVILSRIVGIAGRVFSIEPFPRTFALLNHEVRTLGLTNVVTMDFASSDHDGETTMVVPTTAAGEPDFFLAHIDDGQGPAGGGRARVPLRTLDAALGDAAARVRLIKIDVEGHELECLRGAVEILRVAKPALLVEIWGDPDEPGSAAGRTFAFLERAGYAAFVAQPDGTLKARSAGTTSVNYFFLHS